MSSISKFRSSASTNRNQGGGNKLAGLPPSMGGNTFVRNAWARKATVPYDKRNIVFCINQLGGIGRKSSMFLSTADGVRCVQQEDDTVVEDNDVDDGDDIDDGDDVDDIEDSDEDGYGDSEDNTGIKTQIIQTIGLDYDLSSSIVHYVSKRNHVGRGISMMTDMDGYSVLMIGAPASISWGKISSGFFDFRQYKNSTDTTNPDGSFNLIYDTSDNSDTVKDYTFHHYRDSTQKSGYSISKNQIINAIDTSDMSTNIFLVSVPGITDFAGTKDLSFTDAYAGYVTLWKLLNNTDISDNLHHSGVWHQGGTATNYKHAVLFAGGWNYDFSSNTYDASSQNISATDGATVVDSSSASFGWSVALGGVTVDSSRCAYALIGEPNRDLSGSTDKVTAAGAAYLYKIVGYTPSGAAGETPDSNWADLVHCTDGSYTQITALGCSNTYDVDDRLGVCNNSDWYTCDIVNNAQFGWSVDIDPNCATDASYIYGLIGAPGAEHPTDPAPGKVYTLRIDISTNTWCIPESIAAESRLDPGAPAVAQDYGTSVAIRTCNNTLYAVVGIPGGANYSNNDGANGAVQIYHGSTESDELSWQYIDNPVVPIDLSGHVEELYWTDPNLGYGNSVALSDNYVFVGNKRYPFVAVYDLNNLDNGVKTTLGYTDWKGDYTDSVISVNEDAGYVSIGFPKLNERAGIVEIYDISECISSNSAEDCNLNEISDILDSGAFIDGTGNLMAGQFILSPSGEYAASLQYSGTKNENLTFGIYDKSSKQDASGYDWVGDASCVFSNGGDKKSIEVFHSDDGWTSNDASKNTWENIFGMHFSDAESSNYKLTFNKYSPFPDTGLTAISDIYVADNSQNFVDGSFNGRLIEYNSSYSSTMSDTWDGMNLCQVGSKYNNNSICTNYPFMVPVTDKWFTGYNSPFIQIDNSGILTYKMNRDSGGAAVSMATSDLSTDSPMMTLNTKCPGDASGNQLIGKIIGGATSLLADSCTYFTDDEDNSCNLVLYPYDFSGTTWVDNKHLISIPCSTNEPMCIDGSTCYFDADTSYDNSLNISGQTITNFGIRFDTSYN
jgi:hypothetical protein